IFPLAQVSKSSARDMNQDGAPTVESSLTPDAQAGEMAEGDAKSAHLAGATGVAFRPDVILLDIGMPRLNGYDACRCIRQHPKNMLLIAMTGWGQEDDKRRALEAGFNFHVVKPVDASALEKLLAASAEVPA